MRRITIIIVGIIAFIGSIMIVPRAGAGGAAAAQSGQDEFYDLLIMGIDRRPQQKTGRSDVMLIVHCEPKYLTFFSIPRDSLTLVRNRYDKINHAHAYGGVRLTKVTVERFLKFKIDNYITLDFETFLTTIDVIKKLTDDGRLIGAENFLVSGQNLLKWLRFRSLPKGDRRRCQRHQLFMKRVFEYTQDMYNDQPLLFGQCMKAGLKISETDLAYEHVEALYKQFGNYDLETNLERFVLPGYGTSRYRKAPQMTTKRYESIHMPSFSEIKNDPNMTPEEKAEALKKAQASWHKKNQLISYYIPKHNWSLKTYIDHYRSNGIKINYKEVDSLRK